MSEIALLRRERKQRTSANRFGARLAAGVRVEQVGFYERGSDLAWLRVRKKRANSRPSAISTDQDVDRYRPAINKGQQVPPAAERRYGCELAPLLDRVAGKRVEQNPAQVSALNLRANACSIIGFILQDGALVGGQDDPTLDILGLARRRVIPRATIMLVDDHAIARERHRMLLEKQSALQVVATAGDGTEAYPLYQELKPNLVIMDLTLPHMGGIESIRRILQWDARVRILVFTMHQNAAYAVQAMRAGARGYITKTGAPQALVQAVFDVLDEKIALSFDIDHELALSRLADAGSVLDELTPREFEILRMLMTGQSVDGIADVLNLSRKTVANTHCPIKSKPGVTSDIALVLIALRHGLACEVPEPS